MSWRVEESPPHNSFFGFKVTERISTGAHSSVWQVLDENDKPCVLKVIQIDGLSKGAQLDSFRRGVQSQAVLTENKIVGVPRLIQAFEIPTCIVMEFIPGPNLGDVVSAIGFNLWTDGLQIAISIGKHLTASHDRTVLHRDIRPSNIMVPNYFYSDEYLMEGGRFDVCILNYDMSWHKDASGKTISARLEAAGYYAPEQLIDIDDTANRTSLVDSYGFGMSIFFMATSENPPLAGSKSIDWKEKLISSFRRDGRLSWVSAPNRLMRLVYVATSPVQAMRPTIREMLAELEQLNDALSGNWQSLTASMWAEEVAMRTDYQLFQASPESNGSLVASARAGRHVSIAGDERRLEVAIKFSSSATDASNRTGMGKRLQEKLRAAKQILESGGWLVDKDSRVGRAEITLICSVKTTVLPTSIQEVVTSLSRALEETYMD